MTACNTHVGPVSFVLGQPDWSVAAAPVTGVRPANFGGYAPLSAAYQLNELVNNPDAVQTVGPATGVLAYVYDEQDVLAQLRGWWLLSTDDVRTGLVTMTMVHDRGTNAGWVQVTLAGVMLGPNREVVVTRSARPRSNVYSLVPVGIVADPFWDQAVTGEAFVPPPSGGVPFSREYDPASPHVISASAVTRSMTLYAGTMTGGFDVLPPTVVPAPRAADAVPPSWVANRGGDVRAYDRRRMSEVYGPGHVFDATTDILVTNGLLRFWVGNRGVLPYLNVQAIIGGAWRSVGCLALSASSAEPLRGARIARLTSEMVTVVLTSRSIGDVSVTLLRGARGLEVHHGADRPPFTTTARVVAWLGMPPARAATGTSNGTGVYDTGLLISGIAQWPWPPDQSKTRWAFSGIWLPTSASTSQPDSGLLALLDTVGLVGGIVYTASSRSITFAVGTASVTYNLPAFGAGSPIFWSVSYDSTAEIALVVRTGTTTVRTATPATAGAGTTDPTYDSFAVGAVGSFYGSSPFGTGPFGGSLITNGPNGVTDNLMMFDSPLSSAEAAWLASAPSPMGNLPSPESRLIWYAPFDTKPVPVGSLLSGGRRFEATVEGGSTRAPDASGLTKGLGTLTAVSALSKFGVSATTDHLDVGVFLVTTMANDDLADHHAQFGAASEQEVRVR